MTTPNADEFISADEFLTGPGPVVGAPLAWLEGLLTALGSTRQGRKWQCPAHGLTGAHSVSLALSADDAGRALMWCHSGCGWREVLRALYLAPDALRNAPPGTPAAHAAAFLPGVVFPPPKTTRSGSLRGSGFRFEAEHPYGDPVPWAWKLRYRHPSGAKEIRWESLNPHGERVPGLLGRREADMPLYRAREIRMATGAGETVILCESESSADALCEAGLYSTCWAGGAGSCPIEQIRATLTDADVVLIPDHDPAGLDVAYRILDALPTARVLLGEPGEDARDLLTRVGPTTFAAMVEGTAPQIAQEAL